MARQTSLYVGKTFKYEGVEDHQIGRGTFGFVFVGKFKSDLNQPWETYCGKEEKVAIKRVLLFGKNTYSEIKHDREVIALKTLRHPYIVRLLAVEDDQDFRNFVFEFCQANLEDLIWRNYTGRMPDVIEGLVHMASGLKYIHESEMIHRDIKPENVLISVAKNGEARLKISDLGFTKRLRDDGTHFDVVSGLKGREDYMAAELLRLRNQEGDLYNDCTTATDVFAAGITFFRYLCGGLHPFGRGYRIQENIMNGNPINLNTDRFGTNDRPTWTLVKNMIQLGIKDRLSMNVVVDELKSKCLNMKLETETNDYSYTQVITVEGNVLDISEIQVIGDQGLKLNRLKLIGSGGFGIVFEGYFKDEEVAVKRVQLFDRRQTKQEIGNLIKLSHPNVIRLIHHEDDANFRYIVFELCAASLDHFFLKDDNPKKYKGPMPTDEQVLFQLASGLDYIHSQNIVHRNIKPSNVLISSSKPIQFKWTGFGLSKPVSERGSFYMSDIKGTFNWMAPELLLLTESMGNMRPTTKIDIFSAGCVFFYFLQRGVHPFGSTDNEIYRNIMERNKINFTQLPVNHFAYSFIKQMIDHDPANRIPLSKIMECLEPPQHEIRLSSMSYNDQNILFRGSFSTFYRIAKFGERSLAVKVVDNNYSFPEKFEKLTWLNHPNIIQSHYFDQEENVSYFGMELCAASLDMVFLPDGNPRKYNGPLPSNEEFCFQLTSGLQYIHGEKLVHGSIKPSNILVKDLTIKLSDFGLTPLQWNDGEMSSSAIGGFQSARYWLAPELVESSESSDVDLRQLITEKSDIFAAGCVFFYFLSKGRHLFADEIHKIIPNIVEGKRENLLTLLPHDLKRTDGIIMMLGCIKSMTEKLPEDRPEWKKIIEKLKLLQPIPPEEFQTINGEMLCSKKGVLGWGGQAVVLLGYFKGISVAVKRFIDWDVLKEENKVQMERERKNLEKLNHPNIVKYFGCAEKDPFLFLATERCLTSLGSYCVGDSQFYRGTIPMPPDVQVLLQMAQGLQFIHQQEIIYRDVKPENILISYDNPAVIKWADFGMSRAAVYEEESFSSSANRIDTERWMAPELMEASPKDKMRGSTKCDIFALGCVFFFFLVPGDHPFGTGNKYDVQYTILKNERNNLEHLASDHFAYKIIEGMTECDKQSRLELSNVIDMLESSLTGHHLRPLRRFQDDSSKDGPDTKIARMEHPI